MPHDSRADAIEKLLEDEDLLSRDRAQLKSKMKKNYQGFSRTEMEAHDGVGRANSWVRICIHYESNQ